MNFSGASLVDLFLLEGKRLVVPQSYRLLLHNLDYIYFIEEGDFDLFVLHPSQHDFYIDDKMIEDFYQNFRVFLGDVLTGSLTFMLNVQEGSCLFPFSLQLQDSQDKVLAIAISNVKLRILSVADLLLFIRQNVNAREELNQLANEWINTLSRAFSRHYSENITYHISDEATLALNDGETLALSKIHIIENKNAVIWMKVASGQLAVLGMPSVLIEQDAFYPLTAATWLQSVGVSQIALFSHINGNDFEKYWKGMLAFHQIVLKVANTDYSQKIINEKLASRIRETRDRKLLEDTLESMGSILKEKKIFVVSPGRDPLFRACQIIGAVQLQTFIEPSLYTSVNWKDRLYEISTASNIYSRNVLLSAGWEKTDHGPLLGFQGQDTLKPVALIPSGSGKYQKIDSNQRLSEEVTEKTADQTSAQAAMFYRNFPSKTILEGMDVLKFCLHGRSRELLTVFFVSLVGITLSLFIPFVYQALFDTVVPSLDTALLGELVLGLGILAASMAIFNITREYSLLRMESFLDHDLEAALWSRLLSLPTQFFRKFSVGNLIQRISSIGQIRTIVSGQVVRVIINGVFSLVYLLAMLYYSPTLTMVGLTILSISILVTVISFLFSQQLELKNQNLKGIINGKVVQIILGLTKIRTNGVENRIFSYWAQNAIESKKLSLRIGHLVNQVNVVNKALHSLAILGIFFALIQLMNADAHYRISIGTFLAFNAAFVSFSQSTLDFSNILMEMLSVYPMWKRSAVILQEPSEVSTGRMNPGKLQGEVRIDHLFFRYDSNSPMVHQDVSFQANPGEFIGIVGSSGCGKSTLVRLLLGFENPLQGAIYYDGKDLAHLDLRAVRSQLGVILQNSTIMDGTVMDNITGGNLASEAQVWEAVRLAGFDEDLKKLPMGLRTCLTTGGVTLSGGQRQRLLIARALLNQSKILILDEATNALDNKTQEIVTYNLERMEATRIVIAHRLSTIRKADRIYVMDKGRVVECGTFKELAAQNGLFASLLAHQTL